MPGKSKVCPGVGGREVDEVILREFGLVFPEVVVYGLPKDPATFFAGEPGTEWEWQYRQLPPMSPGGADGAEGGKKEIALKMIYGKAGAGDLQGEEAGDEGGEGGDGQPQQLAFIRGWWLVVWTSALCSCSDWGTSYFHCWADVQGKDAGRAQGACAVSDEGARAKKLPMEVVDVEYQWDRRKLTFYFVAQGIPVDTTTGRHRDMMAGRVNIPWQKMFRVARG
ncbi:hypothetical protein B0H14DRAFT_2655198 [Mycena olivaceomarginata]|nr:hypothetical protein B0H14DRAFT_2655198 [Mycena olivaceomarginata]